MMEKIPRKSVNVYIDEPDIKEIENLVNKRLYESMSHFVRTAVKDLLFRQKYEFKPYTSGETLKEG